MVVLMAALVLGFAWINPGARKYTPSTGAERGSGLSLRIGRKPLLLRPREGHSDCKTSFGQDPSLGPPVPLYPFLGRVPLLR